jgi:hypothetical protein
VKAQPVALGPDVPGVDVAKRVFIGGSGVRTAALPGRRAEPKRDVLDDLVGQAHHQPGGIVSDHVAIGRADHDAVARCMLFGVVGLAHPPIPLFR